ncbi:MAG: hydroxymethylglutaryl-CoA lyase [Hyphomicrobiales bacterium]|nr:hydroxymethylglutaryl-CoA lyase [Hyphomicrobiales bacterium]
MAERIHIYEVAPRDGLQYERRIVPTADKVRLIDLLSGCGFARIEAASMVSPRLIPQMADGADVLAEIQRRPETRYAALAPNVKGYQHAKQAEADEVAVFISASEGFSQANINCSIEASLERARAVADAAAVDQLPLRGYVSCVAACPYDGPTPPAAVARLAAALIALGCYEVSLGDTIGAGEPDDIEQLLDCVFDEIPARRVAGHFHDTGQRALANIDASLGMGVRTFDSSVGGLGGCPFAPGAKGNVDTGEVVRFVHERGFVTGIDTGRLAEASDFALSLKGVAP